MVASASLSVVPSWAKTTIRPPSSRYTELARIGAGATSSVHVGRLTDGGPGPLVAIKRLHGHLTADVTARNSLLAQAAVGSRVAHPNVVAVRDVERSGAQLSVVMDYVEGAALSHLIGAAGGLSWPVALRILVDAATGLHAAHRLVDENGQPLGIVHRKVSPTKILVGVDGVARVSGFGVAKCRGLTVSDSQLGAVRNELSYMAPEFIDGLGLDARADVFALGVVAWELLTGRRLFEAATVYGVAQRVATMRAPRLSEMFPGRKVPFESAIDRALSKDPDYRFSSTGNFAHALAGAAINSCGLAEPDQVAAEVEALARLDLARVRAELGGRGPASTRGHLRSVPPPVPRSRATQPVPPPPSSLPYLRGLPPPPPSRPPSVPPVARASVPPPPAGSFGALPPPSPPPPPWSSSPPPSLRASSLPPPSLPPPSRRPSSLPPPCPPPRSSVLPPPPGSVLPPASCAPLPPPSRAFEPPRSTRRPWVESGSAIRPATSAARPLPPPAPPSRPFAASAAPPPSPPSVLPPPRHATVPPPPASWWPSAPSAHEGLAAVAQLASLPPRALPPPSPEPVTFCDDDLVEVTPDPIELRSAPPPLPPAAARRRSSAAARSE